MHVVADAFGIAAAYMISWWVRFVLMEQEAGTGALSMEYNFMLMAFIIPGYLILYAECGLYAPKRGTIVILELFNIIRANLIGAAVIMMLFFLFRIGDFSRWMLAIFVGLNVSVSELIRILISRVLKYIRKKGYNLKQVLFFEQHNKQLLHQNQKLILHLYI